MSRVSSLESDIKRYAKSYYLGESLISDEEFDSLIDELRELDPTNELLSTVGWGGLESTNLVHRYGRMGSLPKHKYTVDMEVPSEKIYTGKLDGLTVDLQYVDGTLDSALTRGNGESGQDVLDKVRHIVPTKLKSDLTMSVRGEFVLSIDNWRKFYPDQPSPRNIASGVLNRSSVDPEEIKRFAVVVYKIHGITDRDTTGYDSAPILRVKHLDLLKSLGFIVSKSFTVKSNESVTYEEIFNNVSNIDGVVYPYDGLVQSDLNVTYSECDVKGDYLVLYPNEVALKVVTESSEVVITDITYSLTRTGRMVPKVWFDPIMISGASVRRATAHNCEYLRYYDIGVGSIINVVRSGEVIPYISSVVEANGCDLPTKCPECNSELEWVGADLKCTNDNCSSKSYVKVSHWINVMARVDNLGSSLLSTFIESCNINSIQDLYDNIDISPLSSAQGVGSSKLAVIKEMISNLSAPKELSRFFVALNIPGLAWNGASKLETGEMFQYLISNSSPHTVRNYLDSIRGVQWKSKEYIINNWNDILALRQYVNLINPASTVDITPTESVDLLPICVTGKLVNFSTRGKLFKELADKVTEVKIKDAQYLVCNEDKGSSKITYAKKNNIPVITESELIDMLNNR